MATLPALNKFVLEKIKPEVTNTANSILNQGNAIYVTPQLVTAIVLSLQVANTGNNPVLFSAQVGNIPVEQSGNLEDLVYVVKDFEIPVNDVFNPLTGRLIIPELDQLYLTYRTPESGQTSFLGITLSILENANE